MPEQGANGVGRPVAVTGPRRGDIRVKASRAHGRLLDRLHEALHRGDEAEALRYADRARRLFPATTDILHINARLLVRRGEAEAALVILAKLAEEAPDAGIEAEIIEALLALDRLAEAERRAANALRRYAVDEQSPLAKASRRVVADHRCSAPGWMALSSELRLLGEIRLPSPGGLKLAADGRKLVPEEVPRPEEKRDTGFAVFNSSLKMLSSPATVTAEIGGAALLGSGIPFPPDFAFDGRSNIDGRRLTGWVRIGWAPHLSPRLVIRDERGSQRAMEAGPLEGDRRRRNFELDLAAEGLRGGQITVFARLPGGRTEALPDAPLLRAKAVPSMGRADATPTRRTPQAGPAASPRLAPTAVVVPVYRGEVETLACLESVRTTIPRGTRLIVVDDGSPEPALAAALDKLAAEGVIELLRNTHNQGFPAAVNRAFEATAGHDVLLLNSDAVVAGDWLTRLRRAAYSAPDVGTVTPFSDAGSIASYPAEGKSALNSAALAKIDKLAAAVNAGLTVEIPTGVGFCLYIRADCLAATGGFDAETFGPGYGEENDFCLRAHHLGWRHLMAADVFVRHVGGRSFGRRRQALMDRNLRLLNLRYPGYDAMVQCFIAADPIRPCRRRLDEARLTEAGGKHVLLVTLALDGGVATALEERRRELRTKGLLPVILKPEGDRASKDRQGRSPRCRLVAEDESLGDLLYDLPGDLPLLRALLGRLPLSHVELHHFLDHDPRTIELVRGLGAPVDIHVHDYAWLCPRITLLAGNGRYCGEPPIRACERCLKTHGGRLGHSLTVAALRRRSARWLDAARHVIVPTEDTKRRLIHHFPGIAPVVRPLEAPPEPGRLGLIPRGTGTVRVALIGGIGIHKGYDYLLACAADAARRDLPLEFVVIGHTENDDRLMSTGKAFITGRYDEQELETLLRRERPHLVWFASVVPETWCFALSHAIRAGLPVHAFELGALGERLAGQPYATLLSPDLAPSALNRHFLQAMGYAQQVQNTGMPPAPSPTTSTNENKAIPMTQLSAEVTQDRMTVSVQLLTFAEGMYAFLVRSAPPAKVAVDSNILLPAIHVGRGPDTAEGQIEFLAGPHGRSTWLRDSSDVVMARVTGSVSVLVTSLRISGAAPLALEVQRVDGRSVLGPSAGKAEGSDSPVPPGIAAKISAHVQNRGDLSFTDEAWAGLPGQRLWIESFSVEPLAPLVKGDIEYKGLTFTGFETPWLPGGTPCGTRGMGIPLVAFSVRMKSSAHAARYDCEYSGRFLSGATAGPLRNGAPCRSPRPDDPLEAIQLRIVERQSSEKARGHKAAKPEKSQPRRSAAGQVPSKAAGAKAAEPKGAGKAPTPSHKGRRTAKSQTST